MRIVDSHCHVVKEYFGEDQDLIISRACQSGVEYFINPSVTLNDGAEIIALSEKWQQIYAGVGVHPHEAKSWTTASAALLHNYCRHPKVVAVGECGLDFYYKNSVPEVQKAVFAEQIRLARQLEKPIIVHCRDAWGDAIALLKSEGQGEIAGVFHCFTGGPDLLAAIAELDFYVSFSGIVTFPKSQEIQTAAKQVPESRLLAETDCPYLAPQPVRGKRNEPSFVWMVAEKLAELRGTSVDEIGELCADNAKRLFRLPKI